MFDPKYCRRSNADSGSKKGVDNSEIEKAADPMARMIAENIKVTPDERNNPSKIPTTDIPRSAALTAPNANSKTKPSNDNHNTNQDKTGNRNSSKSAKQQQQEEDRNDFETDPTKLQEKVKQQENLVRGELGKKFSKIQEESRKLAQIQHALETLEREQQKDIDILRTRIEKVERTVSTNRDTFKRKEKEYQESKALLEDSEKEKEMLTSHLRLIIFENEKKKEAKLNELMTELGMESNNNQTNNEKGFEGFPSSGKSTLRS